MKRTVIFREKGQTAVEYLLLLGIVVTVVLVGFSNYLPRAQQASNIYFQRVGEGVLGEPSPCGDGNCDVSESDTTCCVDCNIGGYCHSGLPPQSPSLPKPTSPQIPSL